jgi:hypothetical protein
MHLFRSKQVGHTGEFGMKVLERLLPGITALAILSGQARAAETTSLVVVVQDEPAPKLTIAQPLAGPLASGVAFIPYRVENLRILPIGGPAATKVSPRAGHLHITVDDSPWSWADYGQSNTIILINLPKGEHKVLVEVVDPEGRVLASQTLKFAMPERK